MDIEWAIDQGELYLLQVTTSSAYLLVYYDYTPLFSLEIPRGKLHRRQVG